MPLDDSGNYVPRLPDEDFSSKGDSPVTQTQNKAGHGSPVGVVTPNYVGQIYTDLDGGEWVSTGLTSSDWRQNI